jgi:hypothetical protein
MTAAAPTVTAIAPKAGYNDRAYTGVTITGTGFSGSAVTLTKTGETDITATNESVVSATSITCDIDLTGEEVGLWDVVVTNSDAQTGTLLTGFTVTAVPYMAITATPPTVISAGSVRLTPGISGLITPIETFDWDYGDGTAHGTAATPIHAYPTVTVYTSYDVVLTVTEVSGDVHTLTVNDIVSVDTLAHVTVIPTDGTYFAVSAVIYNDTDSTVVNRNPWGVTGASGCLFYLRTPVIQPSIDKIGVATFTILDIGTTALNAYMTAQRGLLAEGNNVLIVIGKEVVFSGLIRRVSQNTQAGFSSTNKVQMFDVECDSDLARLKKQSVASTALPTTGDIIIDSPANIFRRIMS